MSDSSQLVYQNGNSATDIARYSQSDYSVYIQTDDENKVGVQKVMIRDCDALSRLLELNLYISVLENTHPDFVSNLQTSWQIDLNDTVTYQLPQWRDPQNNDQGMVYVAKMEDKEDKYPEFMQYENATTTLVFRPREKWSAGQTYYF